MWCFPCNCRRNDANEKGNKIPMTNVSLGFAIFCHWDFISLFATKREMVDSSDLAFGWHHSGGSCKGNTTCSTYRSDVTDVANIYRLWFYHNYPNDETISTSSCQRVIYSLIPFSWLLFAWVLYSLFQRIFCRMAIWIQRCN